MVRGRKVGQTEVTLEEIETIIEMTEQGKFRSEIAETVGRAKSTVAAYQKKFC